MLAGSSEHMKRILVVMVGILMVGGIAMYHLTDWIRMRPRKVFRLSAVENGGQPITPGQSGAQLTDRVPPDPAIPPLECNEIQ